MTSAQALLNSPSGDTAAHPPPGRSALVVWRFVFQRFLAVLGVLGASELRRFLGGLRELFCALRAHCLLLWSSGVLPGRSWVLLGDSWVLLGSSWVLLGDSWVLLGRSWGLLGAPGSSLGAAWGLLGRSLGIPGGSLDALGVFLWLLGGSLGPPGGSLGAPLGSWGALRRRDENRKSPKTNEQ